MIAARDVCRRTCKFIRRFAAGAILAVVVGSPTVQGQGLGLDYDYAPLPPAELQCRFSGQWLGPWDFEGIINPGLRDPNPLPTDRNWAEIAHAVALPPPNANKVLLLCRRHDTAGQLGGDIAMQSFLWDRTPPSSMSTQFVNATTNGSRDPFCGGQTLTTAGNVIFVGGIDSPQQVNPGGIWGNMYAHLFVNSASPYWVYDLVSMPPMQRARYYPTITRALDGSLVVTGHGANPVVSPLTETTREHADVNDATLTLTWRGSPGVLDTLLDNLTGPDPTCTSTASVDLGEYPRTHQLRGEDFFATNLAASNVMKFSVCASGTNPDRWLPLPASPQPGHEASCLHYIDFTTTPVTEILYSVGGGGDHQTGMTGSKHVLRMQVASSPESSVWTQAGIPQLNAPRAFQNVVILLDGSMLVVGGASKAGTSEPWMFWKNPELYKPPVIFAAPSTQWEYLNPQEHERSYHSVAVVLGTGEVVSAGGQGHLPFSGNPPLEQWYSVEVYAPPYQCSVLRPTITAAPSTLTLGDAQSYTMEATLHSTSVGDEFRVALIGPGAATHAFDFNQIYVKLKLGSHIVNPDPSGSSSIEYFAPSGGVAPGRYMLVVVNSLGLPSEAKWVHLVKP